MKTIKQLRLFYRIAQPPRPCARKKYRCVMCPKKTTTTTEMATHIAKVHSFLKLAVQADQSDDSTVAERTAPTFENLAIIKANLKTKPSLSDKIASVREKHLELLENTTASDILMRSLVKCIPSAETAPLWQCLACRQRFVDKMDLDDHVQLKHVESEQNKSGPLKLRMLGHCCEVCGRCFDELEYMIGHHLVMHPDANPPSFEYLQYSTDWAMLCFTCLLYYRRSEKWFTSHSCTNSVDLDALEKTKCAVAVDPCFLCDVCAATFRYKCAYQYHRLACHKRVTKIDWDNLEPSSIPFVCEECDKGFLKVEDFGAHLCNTATDESAQLQTRTRKVQCEQCNSKFCSVKTMRRHIKMVHEKSVPFSHGRKGRLFRPDIPTIKCPFCKDLKFMTSKDMLVHAKEVHNQELRNPYYCAQCAKEFMTNTKLKEHCETYHTKSEDQKMVIEVCKLAELTKNDTVFYVCNSCSRKFFDPMDYFRHQQRHHIKSEFTCDRCGHTLASKNSLRFHMRNVHRDIMSQFMCDQCNSVLSSQFALREHQAAIHNTERIYMCERCGKDFPTKKRLQTHLRSHLFGSKHSVSYACAQCGKEFKKKETLRNHLAVHSGIKNVACPECGKLFYSKMSAYFHKLHVHCTVRPFKCTTCEASFPLRSYLTRHMKKHAEKITTRTIISLEQTSQQLVAMKSAAQKESEEEATKSDSAQSFLHDFSS